MENIQMNKKHGFIIFIIGLIILSNMVSVFTADQTIKPVYTKDTYMIEMRDGVHLATDVYLPDEIPSTHGSILIRTPYNKDYTNMGDFADAGWPTIVQDMRGRYASEGIDTIFRNFQKDAPVT